MSYITHFTFSSSSLKPQTHQTTPPSLHPLFPSDNTSSYLLHSLCSSLEKFLFPCFPCFFTYFFFVTSKGLVRLSEMPQQNIPPKRGQVKIKIIKGLLKSAAKILSTGSERRRRRESRQKGGGLSSSSTTPGLATPHGYNSDGSLDSLS